MLDVEMLMIENHIINLTFDNLDSLVVNFLISIAGCDSII